jgi:hypothetical protein
MKELTKNAIIKMVENPPHKFDEASRKFAISRQEIVNMFVEYFGKTIGLTTIKKPLIGSETTQSIQSDAKPSNNQQLF